MMENAYQRDDLHQTLIPPEFRFDQTEEFKRHPFTIRCNRCGSGKIRVVPFDHMDLEIKCKTCGAVIDCGVYETDKNDYMVDNSNGWQFARDYAIDEVAKKIKAGRSDSV